MWKRYLYIIIIIVMFIPIMVEAKDNSFTNDHYVFNYANEGYISINHSFYVSGSNTNVTYNYYDEEGNLLQSVVSTPEIVTNQAGNEEYYAFELYCQYSNYWYFESATYEYDSTITLVINLKPYKLEKNKKVYYISAFRKEAYNLEGIFNDGDIILISANVYSVIYNGDISLDFMHSRKNYIKVGYEILNPNVLVEDNYNQYCMTITGQNNSSVGAYLYFYPYLEPKFYIKCNTDKLLADHDYNCSLNIKTNYLFKKIIIKYDKDSLLSNINGNNAYNYDMSKNNIVLYDKEYYSEIQDEMELAQSNGYDFNEENYYITLAEETILDKEQDNELLYFNIRVKEDTTPVDLEKLFELNYKIGMYPVLDYSENSFQLFKNINKNNVIIKNPLTSKSFSVIVIILFSVVVTLIMIISKRKGVEKI